VSYPSNMRRHRSTVTAALFAIVMLASCGGGSGNDARTDNGGSGSAVIPPAHPADQPPSESQPIPPDDPVPIQKEKNIAAAMKVDVAGNLYITGTHTDADRNSDMVTRKLDAQGNQVWEVRYTGQGTSDSARDLFLDSAGNVYITGTSSTSTASMSYTTIKYDTNGNRVWVATYEGFGSSFAEKLTVDNDGNVYVTGTSKAAAPRTDKDLVTVKYDSNGKEIWAARYDGQINWDGMLSTSEERPVAVAADSSGNVYVTGTRGHDVTSSVLTIKYAANGTELWDALYDGMANVQDEGRGLALDGSGNVYVTGAVWTLGADYALLKYDANGQRLWEALYSGFSGTADYPAAPSIDADGSIYVAGGSYTLNSQPQIATLKYDANGNELSRARYNIEDSNTFFVDAVVDAAGNTFATLYKAPSVEDHEFVFIKIDSDGKEVWSARYAAEENTLDHPRGVLLDRSGIAHLIGITPDPALTSGESSSAATESSGSVAR
jgi:hypothetical protein